MWESCAWSMRSPRVFVGGISLYGKCKEWFSSPSRWDLEVGWVGVGVRVSRVAIFNRPKFVII